MEKFRNLGIIEPIIKSIQEQNFERPSEIQTKAIPLILEGKDVIAGASTGSGKTLAFAAGIIKTAEKGKGIQALILTPTRELAEQVSHVIQRFSKNKHLEIISVYGGVSINPQMHDLETADVVIGTPGRILDHIQRKTISFENLKILVLDEADRMLDMGFHQDVEKIIHHCPEKRQTLLFSATISEDIVRLAQRYMNNPIEVSAEVYVDPLKLTQVYYDIEDNLKFSLLVHLLKNEHAKLVMVFCNTQRNTDFVANNLRVAGISALAIHGGYSQDKRTRTMERFTSKDCSVLVCTDVAARGLDIGGISHIYNYDSPKDSKDYIHRIGRTARAGKDGKVINIIASRDYENFQRIVVNKDLEITKEKTPKIDKVFIKFMDDRFRKGQSSRDSRFRRSDNRGGNNRYGDNRSRDNRYGDDRNKENRHSDNRFGRSDNRDNRDRDNRYRDNRFGDNRQRSSVFRDRHDKSKSGYSQDRTKNRKIKQGRHRVR